MILGVWNPLHVYRASPPIQPSHRSSSALLRRARVSSQWISTLLEVLNPTSSIYASIEPFVMAKIKCMSWIFHIFYFHCSKSLNLRTPKTDTPNPWGSIEPRLRTTGLDWRQCFGQLALIWAWVMHLLMIIDHKLRTFSTQVYQLQ